MTESKRKPILCLDFDGVLHAYTSGWTRADDVADGPVPGAMEALVAYSERFDVAVYSSRSNQPGGREAMATALQSWLDGIGVATQGTGQGCLMIGRDGPVISFPTEKPPALVTLDDRAITFDGTWPSVEALLAFRPWNKQPAQPAIAALSEPYGAEDEAEIRRLRDAVVEAARTWRDVTLTGTFADAIRAGLKVKEALADLEGA